MWMSVLKVFDNKNMNIEEGDFTKANLAKSIEQLEALVKKLIPDIINTYGTGNIMSGTLNKFISRINTYLINLRCLLQFIDDPSQTFAMATAFSYTEKEIATRYFIITRFDFFVGTFSLFEDAISNGLCGSLLTEEELESMKVPAYEKILENEEINNLVKTHYPKIHKKLLKVVSFVPFESVICKLRKKETLSEGQESFLMGCKVIRNSLHNNGFHQSPSQATLLMLEEEFTIEAKMPPNFVTLERTVKWVEEIVNLFVLLANKTDWKNIQDNSTVQ